MCQARKIVNAASDARHAEDMAEFDVMIQSIDTCDGGRERVFTFTDGSKLIVAAEDYRWEVA